jgi:hypothetical protein
MPQPLCPWERAPVPILMKAGWELGPVYRDLFIFDATAASGPGPPHSQGF